MDGTRKGVFTPGLLTWHRRKNRREMPWKGEKDPYKIWLSEIILQQTRVEQGRDYYNKFVSRYPNIIQLANAPDEEVFKLWEGLGYYSRCRNLLATARQIRDEFQGQFPADHNQILSLKGVGPYTAAAIASFAFNLPYAVTDGNVMRVLARFFGIRTDILSTSGKKQFSSLSQELLPPGHSAEFNQAIMDFGATVCKPMQALCVECPLQKSCVAYEEDRVYDYPVKSKKAARKKRYLYYIILEKNGRVAVRERTGKDIWRHLNEFILIEKEHVLEMGSFMRSAEFRKIAGKDHRVKTVSGIQSQALTHQEITGRFIHVVNPAAVLPEGFRWIRKKEIADLAFPRFINDFLQAGDL